MKSWLVSIIVAVVVFLFASRQIYGIEMVALTGPGIIDPDIKRESLALIEACNKRSIGAQCQANVNLIRRGEVLEDAVFSRLPAIGQAVGITYFSVISPFKNIFIKKSLKLLYSEFTFKEVIWHEMAHAVFMAEHLDDHASIMNSGFGDYDTVKSHMSWSILEEQLFREVGFQPATKLKFECNSWDASALGILQIDAYCSNALVAKQLITH